MRDYRRTPAAIAPALRYCPGNNGLSKYANRAAQYFMAERSGINKRVGTRDPISLAFLPPSVSLSSSRLAHQRAARSRRTSFTISRRCSGDLHSSRSHDSLPSSATRRFARRFADLDELPKASYRNRNAILDRAGNLSHTMGYSSSFRLGSVFSFSFVDDSRWLAKRT